MTLDGLPASITLEKLQLFDTFLYCPGSSSNPRTGVVRMFHVCGGDSGAYRFDTKVGKYGISVVRADEPGCGTPMRLEISSDREVILLNRAANPLYLPFAPHTSPFLQTWRRRDGWERPRDEWTCHVLERVVPQECQERRPGFFTMAYCDCQPYCVDVPERLPYRLAPCQTATGGRQWAAALAKPLGHAHHGRTPADRKYHHTWFNSVPWPASLEQLLVMARGQCPFPCDYGINARNYVSRVGELLRMSRKEFQAESVLYALAER